MLETLQGIAATHFLKSQGQALSAGLKHNGDSNHSQTGQQNPHTFRSVNMKSASSISDTHNLQLRDIKLMRRVVPQIETVTTCPDIWKLTKTIFNYALFISDLYRVGILRIGSTTFVEMVAGVAYSTGTLTGSELF